MVFPLYHVLADLGEAKGAEVLASRSSRPLAVVALALRRDDARVVLVANLTPTEQRCTLEGLPDGPAFVRTLDEETALEAAEDPEAFRSRSETASVAAGRLELTLLPYAVVRLEL
jgi:D-apionolactonase